VPGAEVTAWAAAYGELIGVPPVAALTGVLRAGSVGSNDHRW